MKNVLPKGWKDVLIGSVIQKTTNLKPKETPNNDFTYIDISSINRETQKIESPKIIKGNHAPSRAKKQVQKNDIIFATTRPNLKNIAIIKQEYNNPVASTGFCILRPKHNFVINSYLFYYLITDRVQNLISPFIRGAQYPAISDKNLLSLSFPLPPLPEQQRIVNKLDALFARIDEAIQLVEANLDLIPSLKMALLDKAFKGQLFGEVSLDKNGLPKRWEWKELREVANFKNGFAFKSKEFNTNKIGFQVLRIGNVLNINKNPVYIESNEKFEPYRLAINDIIISLTGTRKKKDYLFVQLIKKDCYYLNQRVGKLTPKNELLNYQYLFFYLKSNLFRNEVFKKETGAVNQGNISGKDIQNQKIQLPPIKEQIKIIDTLDQLFNKLSLLKIENKSKLKHLQDLKKSLLEQAFQGKL